MQSAIRLFMSENILEWINKYPDESQAQVLRRLKLAWKEMTSEEQDAYFKLAREERD